MRRIILFGLLICVMMASPLLAQPGGGGGGGPGGGEPVPLPGLGILMAAGALLGIRSIVKRRKLTSQK